MLLEFRYTVFRVCARVAQRSVWAFVIWLSLFESQCRISERSTHSRASSTVMAPLTLNWIYAEAGRAASPLAARHHARVCSLQFLL